MFPFREHCTHKKNVGTAPTKKCRDRSGPVLDKSRLVPTQGMGEFRGWRNFRGWGFAEDDHRLPTKKITVQVWAGGCGKIIPLRNGNNRFPIAPDW